MTECIEQNYAFQNQFRFEIARAPNFSYTIQDFGIPGISLGEAPRPTIMLDYQEAGEKHVYAPLVCTFNVQVNFANWLEIYNWMNEIAGVEMPPRAEHPEFYEDASMFILDNQNNPVLEIKFFDLFPIDVTEVNFDTRNTEEANSSVTFQYSHFEVIEVC